MIGKCDKNIPDIKLDERNFWEEKKFCHWEWLKNLLVKLIKILLLALKLKV